MNDLSLPYTVFQMDKDLCFTKEALSPKEGKALLRYPVLLIDLKAITQSIQYAHQKNPKLLAHMIHLLSSAIFVVCEMLLLHRSLELFLVILMSLFLQYFFSSSLKSLPVWGCDTFYFHQQVEKITETVSNTLMSTHYVPLDTLGFRGKHDRQAWLSLMRFCYSPPC